MFGPAITVKMVEISDRTSPSLSRHFADFNEQGKVMYVQQPKGLYSACWGGLMSTRANYLGASGVVIDGRTRDVNEHRDLGFPVRGYYFVEELNNLLNISLVFLCVTDIESRYLRGIRRS